MYCGYWSMPVQSLSFFSALCVIQAPCACMHIFGPTKFRMPRTLLQTVASNCSLTLKRIEIHGSLAIRMDRIELLLKACTLLEVFRIECVELFDPEWHVYDSPCESDPDEDDLESERTSNLQSDDEMMKRSWHERERVMWPTDTKRQHMVLSNLYTLQMYPFYLYPGILTLPALCCVGARLHERANPKVCLPRPLWIKRWETHITD